MDRSVRSAIEARLGARITRTAHVSGGDINEAYELGLEDGRTLFAKTNERADPKMFPAEARGLEWLDEAGALRVPKVVAVSTGEHPAFLVLEHLRSASPRPRFDEELGQGLARLHRQGAPGFGLDHPNFIGRLPQPNAPRPTWVEFFREQRLEFQLGLAAKAGLAGAGLRKKFDRLYARLADLVGPEEPPARLHGDLWGGNLHTDDSGAPCLIDPAVYGGHREIDLGMMRLFGGFGSNVFAAYAEAHPLAEGHEDRIPLYQIYPLLVHVNLFGGGYVASVERAVSRYVG